MSSMSRISPCHCQRSVLGQMINSGRSPVRAMSWAAIASCSVLPSPTWSAST
jgi:hypothetical protein